MRDVVTDQPVRLQQAAVFFGPPARHIAVVVHDQLAQLERRLVRDVQLALKHFGNLLRAQLGQSLPLVHECKDRLLQTRRCDALRHRIRGRGVHCRAVRPRKRHPIVRVDAGSDPGAERVERVHERAWVVVDLAPHERLARRHGVRRQHIVPDLCQQPMERACARHERLVVEPGRGQRPIAAVELDASFRAQTQEASCRVHRARPHTTSRRGGLRARGARRSRGAESVVARRGHAGRQRVPERTGAMRRGLGFGGGRSCARRERRNRRLRRGRPRGRRRGLHESSVPSSVLGGRVVREASHAQANPWLTGCFPRAEKRAFDTTPPGERAPVAASERLPNNLFTQLGEIPAHA